MLTYMIQRVLILIPMLLVISFLVYLGLELTPGDAVSHMISPELAGQVSQEKLEELRAALGLNKSFIERYGIWLFNALQGKLRLLAFGRCRDQRDFSRPPAGNAGTLHCRLAALDIVRLHPRHVLSTQQRLARRQFLDRGRHAGRVDP